MANEKIRIAARSAKVPLWKVADAIGVSESTLTRWLRVPLATEHEETIMAAISKLEADKNER